MQRIAAVFLTTGDRPTELAAAIASARSQEGVDVEIVLVVNGGDPDRRAADIVVEPGENVGIPGGRNLGIAAATTEYIAVLDDDARYEHPDLLRRGVTLFDEDPAIGVLALRMVDTAGTTSRRHQPTLRTSAPTSGSVTSFPGCGWIVRRRAFDEVGGLCDEFFYGLEETDLSWRLIDRGWTVHYAADLIAFHPRTDPRRHPTYFEHTARNRVWLARRSLPLPIAIAYLVDWTIITAVRNLADLGAIRAHLSGTAAGLRSPRPGARRPMAWRTVWRLTRLGRPPVI